MALTQVVRETCPTCGKIAVETSRLGIGKTRIIRLACGHIKPEAMLDGAPPTIYSGIISDDGKTLREYQIEGVKFGERANGSFLLADEQGLGKTVQISALLKLHREKLLPAVLVVPTSVKLQWMWELRRWCGTGPEYLTQVIKSGKEKAMPGFQIYIVTFDMLKNLDMFEYVPDIRTIIVDECQRIKNHLSARAKAVQRIGSKCEQRIGMSGTPIKNNAGEFFTILNLVAPRRFASYQQYLDRYCDTYDSGFGTKVGGLKDVDRFHEDTKDIILRRVKAEVMPDLPALDRKFYHVELDPKLNKAYAAALKELDDLIYSEMSEFDRGSQTIAIMGRLRHITGISKVEECLNFTTEFLLSTDDTEVPVTNQVKEVVNGAIITRHEQAGIQKVPRKLTIFTHHQDVMDLLAQKITEYTSDGGMNPPLVLHSGLGADARQALVERFKLPGNRVMIASTLAAGEGLNLQFCSDAVMLERQWNPPNEEQAEARFHRFGQTNAVTITYMIASGTIDEYFTELVEVKRGIIASALDKREITWEQQSLMKELAEMLVSRGRERWKL